MAAFDSVDSALRRVAQLESRPLRSSGAWDVPHVLHHVAQSIEYSMNGFPRLKPAWFRASLGRAAFALFSWRGRMRHGLDQPIPGAPDIAQGLPLPAAIAHAVLALRTFERHAVGVAQAARQGVEVAPLACQAVHAHQHARIRGVAPLPVRHAVQAARIEALDVGKARFGHGGGLVMARAAVRDGRG